jgi:3-methyladenine DNA glycosylase AlkD
METSGILNAIRADLAAAGDDDFKQKSQRFYKEPAIFYGINNTKLKEINRKHLSEVKKLTKPQVFELFESMLKNDYNEEAFLVTDWLPRFKGQFEKDDLKIFKSWIDKYLNNWAKIDTFCNHSVADHLEKFPNDIDEIKSWVKSRNRWMRRAAAVTLILPARRGKYLSEVFEIADALIADEDDMVRKGYGWLLKEASRQHQREVFEYVMKNKALMPRVALRYAIEKMPENLRKKAMEK